MHAASKVKLASLAQVLPWPYLACGRDGIITNANRHIARLLGVDATTLANQPLSKWFKVDDGNGGALTETLSKVTAGHAWHGRLNYLSGSDRVALEVVLEADPADAGQVWLIALENPIINEQMVLSARSELRLLQILMDHTIDYVFFLDLQGRFIITNASFQNALKVGFPGQEIGREFGECVEEQTAKEFAATSAMVLASGKPLLNHVSSFRFKNGEGHWVQSNKVPVVDRNRKCIGLVCVSRDITPQREYEEKLRTAIRQANLASQAKSDFLANVSHEIRTPINGIIGMSELCLETTLNTEQQSYLQSVLSCSNTLLSLINDILDFSKIEAGQLQLENISFNLLHCLEETVAQFSFQTLEKGLELVMDFDTTLPQIVRGDPTRLKQIVYNLLSNAIKFTDEGEIVVRARPIEVKDDHARIVLSVSDTGIGIPQSRQEMIFQSFTQADASTTRKFGGTGLGLAICKKLCEIMGGGIRVESKLRKGSTFEVEIPFGVPARQPISAPVRLARLKGLRVLIIDDNETNRTILSRLCEQWGFAATAVSGGLEGLDLLENGVRKKQPIQIVLLDQHMPELSGLDIAALVLNRPSLAGVKIILLSSSLNLAESNRAAALGVSRSLTKPVKQKYLLDLILEEMGPSAPATTLSATTRTATTGAAGTLRVELTPPSAYTPRHILLVEDNPINQEVCLKRLNKMGHKVTVAANGAEAVEAYRKGEFDLVLMDVQMPVMDGFEATQRIRDIERTRDRYTPIVAMTARAMKGDEEHCLRVGMDGYMAKPFSTAKLTEILLSIEPISPGIVPKAAPRPVETEAELEPYDLPVLLGKLAEDDADDLLLAAEVFVRHYADEIAALEKAWKSGVNEDLHKRAHRIKGGVAALRAWRAQRLAAEIEAAARQGDRAFANERIPELAAEMRHMAAGIQAVTGKKTAP
ncbi:MAG TPA: response regulator [Opitutales bacterium]|jgi:two-component system sensor histidine kinase/response regulator|nr:response regulator [Opitutales bacterium]